MIPKVKERRSYVRGDFSYHVKFRIVSPDEYRLKKLTGHQISFADEKKLKIETVLDDTKDTDMTINTGLIEYLVRIDEKLDQILSMLSDSDERKKQFKHGFGVDISATGMGIITDIPVVPGQHIQANIILSRLPLIRLDVMGEVVQVMPVSGEDKSMYHIGIQFMDMNSNDKEKIIKCVFRNERASIRERKRSKYISNQ
jgi:PilZ domain-containing protein